jgi:hypothetical protein
MNKNIKIVFVGDYSGVNSNLVHVLKKNGVKSYLYSEGDGYKGYERDVDLKVRESSSKIFRLISLLFKLLGFGGYLTYKKNKKKFENVYGFDFVVFSNPIAIESFGLLGNFLLLRMLLKRNKKFILQAIGDDYTWVRYCLDSNFKYSPMDGINFSNLYKYIYSVRYIFGPFWKGYHSYCLKKSSCIIAGLIDYKIPYDMVKGLKVYLLPFVVLNEDVALSIRPTPQSITVFNSWQKGKELRKGNDLFEDAVKSILKENPGLFKYIKPSNNVNIGTYKSNLELYDVIFDQCYSQDRGMTAVYAMARGKVVFTGWENDILKEYSSSLKMAAINALPSVKNLRDDLLIIISDVVLMQQVQTEALQFIKQNHSEAVVFDKFMNILRDLN